MKKTRLTAKKEFGDFQTPLELSRLMVEIINDNHVHPNVIIEPTCGLGNILITAYNCFRPQKTLGIEINKAYCKTVSEILNENKNICLFIGNPPWVTNSDLGAVKSNNLPKKTNLKNLRGIEAITGKSNFDITEYIIIRLLEEFSMYKSIFAFLCKTSVARNILKYCWKNGINYNEASIFPIDSKKYFGAAVDACYFIIDSTKKKIANECKVFDSIEERNHKNTIGIYQNAIIANMDTFKSHNYIGKSDYNWRNGIKHDCSNVMEFDTVDSLLINGYGEIVDIEDDLLYPLLKSSDVANGKIEIRKKVLITQKQIGEDTGYIQSKYPKTWKYLNDHADDFKKRKSSR